MLGRVAKFARHKKDWDKLNLQLDCAKAALAQARFYAVSGDDANAAYHLNQFRMDLRGSLRVTRRLGIKAWNPQRESSRKS